MSRNTTSGLSARIFSSASRPSPASPTTSTSGSASSRPRTRWRACGSSSTTRTFSTAWVAAIALLHALFPGQLDHHAPDLADRAGFEPGARAVQRLEALAHVAHADALAIRRLAVDRTEGVLDQQPQLLADARDADLERRRPAAARHAVLDRVLDQRLQQQRRHP